MTEAAAEAAEVAWTSTQCTRQSVWARGQGEDRVGGVVEGVRTIYDDERAQSSRRM